MCVWCSSQSTQQGNTSSGNPAETPPSGRALIAHNNGIFQEVVLRTDLLCLAVFNNWPATHCTLCCCALCLALQSPQYCCWSTYYHVWSIAHIVRFLWQSSHWEVSSWEPHYLPNHSGHVVSACLFWLWDLRFQQVVPEKLVSHCHCGYHCICKYPQFHDWLLHLWDWSYF